MKKTILLTSILMALTASTTANAEAESNYRAYNTPVNYNYGAVSIGSISQDGMNDETVLQGGGEAMLNENWIFGLSYIGAITDEKYVTGLASNVNFSISRRFALADKLDIVLGGGVIYSWLDFNTYNENFKNNDFGILASTSLRYGFTEKFEGMIGLSSVNIYDDTSTSISGSISYYPTNRFGFGLSLSEPVDDNSNASIIAAHIKFNF